ncbi:hypothetical protein Y032_0016g3020 [Ancylostoma ceylanicum]|uniref:Neuropeptide-like protein 31 family protein n=1 Tax=Ancylostoma ceylanicum TaxID=53326 RepID=A0A016V6M4_9BILA|nr:hypothetical protein Y032_0016g3020 [Ancylostoma ceylanicum]
MAPFHFVIFAILLAMCTFTSMTEAQLFGGMYGCGLGYGGWGYGMGMYGGYGYGGFGCGLGGFGGWMGK